MFLGSRSRKKEERNRKEKEKRKKSSEKADSGLHVAACEKKFQPCRGMILLCHGIVIVFVFRQTGNGLHVGHVFPMPRYDHHHATARFIHASTCPSYIFMQKWQRATC